MYLYMQIFLNVHKTKYVSVSPIYEYVYVRNFVQNMRKKYLPILHRCMGFIVFYFKICMVVANIVERFHANT
jgi:hypothetical protein